MRQFIMAALVAVTLPLTAHAQSRAAQPTVAALESRVTATRPVRGASNAHDARQLICRGAPVPDGFILVDDIRDREQCGGSNPSALRLYNVWVIERYDDRPVGTTIDVCAATPVPEGWVLVDIFRSQELCGHPTDVLTVNVKRIRRAR
jgi:hypothetical protein